MNLNDYYSSKSVNYFVRLKPFRIKYMDILFMGGKQLHQLKWYAFPVDSIAYYMSMIANDTLMKIISVSSDS
uniref:Uncharacterized protein n=1 Tax=Onchocerca volvulus TaxID=6282 RepID=A0A8R1TND5_ONCVO